MAKRRYKMTRRELHKTYQLAMGWTILIMAGLWIYGDTRAFNTIQEVRAGYAEHLQAARDQATLTAMIEAAEPELLAPPALEGGR